MITKNKIFKIISSASYAYLILSTTYLIYAMDIGIETPNADSNLDKLLKPIYDAIPPDLREKANQLDAYHETKLQLTLRNKQKLAGQYFEDAGMIDNNPTGQAYIIKSFLLRCEAAKEARNAAQNECITYLGIFLSSLSKKEYIYKWFGGQDLLKKTSEALIAFNASDVSLGKRKDTKIPSSGSVGAPRSPSFSPSTSSRSSSSDSPLPHKKQRTE